MNLARLHWSRFKLESPSSGRGKKDLGDHAIFELRASSLGKTGGFLPPWVLQFWHWTRLKKT